MTQFNAWHLESIGYRRLPDNPNRFVHADAGKPSCFYFPITITHDMNLGQCMEAIARASFNAGGRWPIIT